MTQRSTNDLASSPAEVQPLLIGAPVPEVVLHTVEGNQLELRAAVAARRSVLIFYRGGW